MTSTPGRQETSRASAAASTNDTNARAAAAPSLSQSAQGAQPASQPPNKLDDKLFTLGNASSSNL